MGDIATFINGRAYSQDELLNSGKYKVLRVGNFYTNDSWYYSDMELADKYYAENGDLLYTWSATFGPHIWCGDKVIYHYHIWKIELSKALEKNFALQLLERDKQVILSDKNGSTMVHITKARMEGKEVLLPPNIDEQEKIGDYFSNLDHLITLHQRKCYVLRFEHIYDWEQRKVSEITSSYSGGTPKAETAEYYDGDIPFIRSGEIYADTTDLFITEDGLNSSSAKMIHMGDILYALYGATSGEVSRARLDGAINQAILAIIPNDGVNADFLVEWFRKEKVQITDKYLQGGQGNLSAQIIKDLEVTIPTREEQNKIGEYFSKLNHLITLHQRKYKWVKKIQALTKTQRKAIKILIKILFFIGKILYNRWKL